MPFAEENEIWPWAFGSGKFGTPFLRMQPANFASCSIPPPPVRAKRPPRAPPTLVCEPGPPAAAPPLPVAVGVVPVVVVVEPRFATESPGLAAAATGDEQGEPGDGSYDRASPRVCDPRPAGKPARSLIVHAGHSRSRSAKTFMP